MRAIGCAGAVLLLLCGCGKNENGSNGNPSGGPAQHALHLRVTGNGQIVSANPAFACRTDCTQSLDAAATAHLGAIPDTGWKFDGWQGACTGTGACDVTMSADHDVTVSFSAAPPPPPGTARVSVQPVGNGTGHITSSPAGIDCPSTCMTTVPAGSAVSLTAQADANSSFAGWGGGCSGPGNCSVSANGDVVVWANFTANITPPPPPPPPPPAQCASLTPGAPPSAMSIAISNQGSCGTGMGDTTGTLGLQSFSSPGGDTLHFINADTANQNGVAAYSNTKGSFVPTRDGFTGVFHYLTNTDDGWVADYWRHDAFSVQSGSVIHGNIVSAGTPFGTVAIAGTLNWADRARRPQLWMLGWNETDLRCGHDLASAGTVFGLGGDANGRVLVVTDGGSGNIDAQWFNENCTAMTGAFRLITGFQAGANTWFETAPLVEGGVAVRRVDQQNDIDGRPFRAAQWLLTVRAGSATPQTAPKWLTDRPNTNM
jgi:hypothetical protein